MPGPQDQPVMVVNMQSYPELRDKKAMVLMRLQAERYQLVIRKYDPQNGHPADPDVLPINRKGAQAFADGLQKEIDGLQAEIEARKVAIANLTGPLIADMDALDKAAKSAGDI